MKKLVMLLIVGAIITAPAVAQPSPQKDPKKDRLEWEKKIKDELKLNADQLAKFDAINKEYSDKIDAIAQDAGLSKDVQKERKMALKKEKEGKVLEILTPDQQAKYKELMEKKKKEMAPKPEGSN